MANENKKWSDSALDVKFKDLDIELKEHNKRLNGHDKDIKVLTKLANGIDTLNTKFDASDKKNDEFKQEVNQKFDEVKQEVNKANERVEQIEKEPIETQKKRHETLITAVITTIVGVVIGAVVTALITLL